MHGNQWVLKIAVLKYYSVSKRGTTAKSNPKQATDPISLHTKFGDNSSNTFPLNERKPCVTPDIGRRTSDGGKSKNNISTPQGGGHNDVHLALARGEATAVVLLDQSAAFDTIDHGTLLGCLSSWFGISGVVLEWFKSYLSDHLQCVKIGSILSGAKKLLCGVPQGSVLGPILFSLYTTPLSKVIQNHPGIGFHFYADDTQLYVHLTHKNVSHAFDRLERCLEDVKKWLSANKLKLNPDKTEFIVFGSKIHREKLDKSFPVNILGNFLSLVGVVRNLGVWFDSDFSFSRHVQNICKSCFAQIRDLRRLRGYLTHHAALMAANALVGSRLDYCNSLFRSLSALDLRKLQCVQNSLARIVTNTTKYSHITPVRKILHWLPIEQRSIFKTALLVYKFLNCGQPRYFAPFLKPRQSVYNTRKAKLSVCSLRFPTLPPHYISLLSISASALLMTLQRFGMICLMMYVRPLLSTHSEGSSKPISSHKHICPDFCFEIPSFLSVALTFAMSQVYDYSFLLLFGAPRVCLWIEIRRYKNTIRIRIRTS